MVIVEDMEAGWETCPGCGKGWLAVPADLLEEGGCRELPEKMALRWALVLDARLIPCRIERCEGESCLLVPAELLLPACSEIRLFEEENRNWPPPEPESNPLIDNTLSTLSVLLLLAIFHNLTLVDISLYGHDPVGWTDLGAAKAGMILDGQWWRLVTSLTLHADWLHLFSNLAFGGLFIVWLCRDIGSGLAWSLLLLSGILGNLANAIIQSPVHSSVGASTMVFGAVGLLAGISLVRHRQSRIKRWTLPVAAALALLALLGTEGKNTDIGAHLFGFLAGFALGLPAEFSVETHGRPGPIQGAILSACSAVVVIMAWRAALLYGR